MTSAPRRRRRGALLVARGPVTGRPRAGALAAAVLLLVCACERPSPPPPAETTTSALFVSQSAESPTAEASAAAPPLPSASAAAPERRESATLIAGGDACLARLVGQEILKNPAFNPFESTKRWLDAADIRFVNLESQLSDQKGETQSPTMKLVFTGPPGGADALARGRIDIVSLANNHMWDYGRSAFFETLDNLERTGVKYAGAGRTRERAYAPEVIDAGGFRVAFVAFTDIWNQGALEHHVAKDHVARASREAVVAGVRAARALPDVDAVVVSYHGGEEYVSVPLQRAVDLHRAAIDAGADAVIGHHPHVAQGVEIHRGKPIFYSLGNHVMRTHREHGATEIGLFARVTFSRGAPPRSWICPFRIGGVVPRAIPLVEDSRAELYERVFRQRVRVIQGSIASPATIGPTADDGCAQVTERAR